jgi:phenylpropionate dioxygenase-like ring-hydroxylating dioxygenase large terminal subunit
VDPGLFALERERVFRRVWIFAGLASALAEPGAYIAREIGGIPVALINHDGELRAFENLCTHRSSPLYTQDFGQGRPVCPYHGWVFDSDTGAIKTLPNADTLYGFSPEECDKLALRRFAVEKIGGLVFINLAENPLPIEEQFSQEFRTEVEKISRHFGALSIHANLDCAYNWKINHENVLDFNHIPYVHPKTFVPIIGDSRKNKRAYPPLGEADIPDDLRSQSIHRQMALKIKHYPWHEKVDRYCGQDAPLDSYYNFFTFPNVNFISVGGLVFLVQQFHPVAPGRTQVRFTLCAAKEKERLPGLPAILWAHMRAEVAILHEDRRYLEDIQRTLHAGAPVMRQGNYEKHLISFNNALLRLMREP